MLVLTNHSLEGLVHGGRELLNNDHSTKLYKISDGPKIKSLDFLSKIWYKVMKPEFSHEIYPHGEKTKISVVIIHSVSWIFATYLRMV